MDQVSRRTFLKAAGAGSLAFTLAGMPYYSQNFGGKPNVIYIMADDLGYGDLGCFGQTKFRTPNIDAMAEEGIRFTRHYAGSTVCAPSRCSLLTGKHTGHSYIRGNRETGGYQLAIPENTMTVGHIFQRAGYRTGLIGKWGLGGPETSGVPNKQGFDYFYGYLGQVQAHFYYPEHLWENDRKVSLPEGTYSHDLFAEKALDFIRENKTNPFFLYIPFTIPHAELKVPEDSLSEYKGKFEEKPFPGRHYGGQEYPRAAYAAMVSRMDRDVGRIRKLLKELGLEKDTLIIFTSDNGPHKEGGNDPQFFNSGGGLRGIKRDLYEGGIRVPFAACWPGRIKPGTESAHVSAFWDFLPTMCELSGSSVPPDIDGISYLPSLLGKNVQKDHKYLYWEFHERGGRQAILYGNWKGIRLSVKRNPDSPLELYNLKNDPGEKNNIAAEHPEIVQKIEDFMKAARSESAEFPFVRN